MHHIDSVHSIQASHRLYEYFPNESFLYVSSALFMLANL
jgi:hypothetical protein